MAKAGFWDGRADAQALLGELRRTKAAIEPVIELQNRFDDIKALGELTQEEETVDSVEELDGEVSSFATALERVESRAMLAGEDDHRNAFLSIHAGAGGTESCDWAEMLYRMYSRWMESNKYEYEVVDLLQGEEAGIKRITLRVEGSFSYGYLKAEMGVHRLVRISPFDSNKRRHTSFASVDCIPELDDEEVEINAKDLQVDTYRSSGPGGQHVNKTDSAVRITHIPTGIVVQCQNERSQHKNRRMAMSILSGKLHQLAVCQRAEGLAKQRGQKTEIAWGNQIRSYVLHPYTMVKDHRTGVETSNAEAVLNGDIRELIEAYLKKQIGGNDERQ